MKAYVPADFNEPIYATCPRIATEDTNTSITGFVQFAQYPG